MSTASAVDTRVVRLTIPARPEYITLGRLALTAIARLHELADDVVGDLKLALTEACTNSVRHAYAEGEGAVEILYELRADQLVVEVGDEGPGFTPPAADSRRGEQDEDDLAEGGLGIAIIRALTDELEFVADGSGSSTGSRLRFVKYLRDA